VTSDHTHTIHLFASVGRSEQVHHIGEVEIDSSLSGDDLAAAFESAFKVLASATPAAVEVTNV